MLTIRELLTEALLYIPEAEDTLSCSDIKAGKRFRSGGGVYTFYNRFKEPLYVGISGNVGKRVAEHLHEGRGNKDLYRYVSAGAEAYVSVFYEDSRVYQEIYESYLIDRLQPRYNVAKTGRERIEK